VGRQRLGNGDIWSADDALRMVAETDRRGFAEKSP
jgi:tRNA-dihydrouridine synthase